ncbi:hypothetical protein LWF01_19160 [Saxibacter everestensis]|uniref:Uncharacterized protein n=1 Tax=Saxibacter everestensis TaxID=2909229 RepID=A0ABY8QTM5_9MICO|nr:hypothetical protein LWF01_19160 [Brevibacteriaceae bacterium ZFBP1038]
MTIDGHRRVNWATGRESPQVAGVKGYVDGHRRRSVDVEERRRRVPSLVPGRGHSFRRVKNGLRARPMFHHERDSIEAHLTIVFCALAISDHFQGRWCEHQTHHPGAAAPRNVVINVRDYWVTATTSSEGEAADILSALRPDAGH